MNMLDIVFLHVIYSSFIAGILIILLFVSKKILKNRFSARLYHMLWVLVLIRLLMPFTIESSLSISNLFPEKIQTVSNSHEHIFNNEAVNKYDYTGQVQPPTVQDQKYGNNIAEKNVRQPHQLTLRTFAIIWLMGFLSFVFFFCIITFKFKLRSRNFTRVYDPEIQQLLENCCEKLNIKKSIPVYMDACFRSPCISGLIKPGIYLPEDICSKVSHYELQHILLHELAHYKRKDLFYSLFTVLAALVHWFNPLVWLAVKEMRYDRELAADACVMEILGEKGKMSYGMTIISLSGVFAHQNKQFNLVSFNETKSQMERRITMIKLFEKGSYKIPALAILCCIVLGAVTLTQAVNNKTDKPVINAAPENEMNIMLNDKAKEKLVIIDPGHGGIDLGGCYLLSDSSSKNVQVKEKEINLDISLQLYDMLKKSGIKVEMTHYEDNDLKLEDRIELANSMDVSLFVSIHNGMSPDSSRNGTLTFYNTPNNESSYGITGEKAGQIIQEELVKQLGTADAGLNEGKFKVLRETNMPAVITEIAYITNESDRERLMTESFRTQTAQALHDSIIKILNQMVSSSEPKVSYA